MLLQPRRGYTPDFLSPPPTNPLAQFDDDLARIAATPHNQVTDEIARSLADTPGAADSETGQLLLGPPDDVLAMLIGLIEQAWLGLVEPVWPQVKAVLDADIGFRPGASPKVVWTGCSPSFIPLCTGTTTF